MVGSLSNVQKKIEQWKSHLLCYEVQLLDPEYLAKCVGFTNLMMAWLVRLVDPKGKHPHQKISCVPTSSLSQSIILLLMILVRVAQIPITE